MSFQFYKTPECSEFLGEIVVGYIKAASSLKVMKPNLFVKAPEQPLSASHSMASGGGALNYIHIRYVDATVTLCSVFFLVRSEISEIDEMKKILSMDCPCFGFSLCLSLVRMTSVFC